MVIMKHRMLIVLVAAALGLVSACSLWEQDLGNDLLPPRDGVFLFDTIFGISAATVPGLPLLTSDRSLSASTRYMLGSLQDSIGGYSEATIFTHFNPTSSYVAAANTEIDSIVLYLYLDHYFGNTEEAFTVSVHESETRIYLDSTYYSDFDVEGKYNPDLLAQATLFPDEDGSDTLKLVIENQDFINKFLNVQEDSALFQNDSLFKDYFKGLYLTASSTSSDGSMAAIGLSDPVSRLAVRYTNDSIEVDSTAERDFRWATFTINEYTSQKVNAFSHDYSGTPLEGILDDPSGDYPYCYVQGLGGVNTRISFDGLDEWLNGNRVAISSAALIFDVVPEKKGGLPVDDQPEKMMVFNELEDGTLRNFYDYYIIAQTGADEAFGGRLQPESRGMFFDTTYHYRFNVGLHMQYLVDQEVPNYPVRLQVYNSAVNPKISMLWSNLLSNPGRIRLEVVYLKL